VASGGCVSPRSTANEVDRRAGANGTRPGQRGSDWRIDEPSCQRGPRRCPVESGRRPINVREYTIRQTVRQPLFLCQGRRIVESCRRGSCFDRDSPPGCRSASVSRARASEREGNQRRPPFCLLPDIRMSPNAPLLAILRSHWSNHHGGFIFRQPILTFV
jgi:hypothetical protein